MKISLLNALQLKIQFVQQHPRSLPSRLFSGGQTGKRPVEEAMIEIKRKKLDLMQSIGKEQEYRDTTCHFLMSLRDPINKLPENRQMFLRVKIQEMIF
jgi:hypothetical protein